MFQNDGGNNNKPSVTTPIETMFGDLSYLQLGLMDDKMSFKWVPATHNEGRRSYDGDRYKMTTLNHKKIEALLARYRAVLRDKITNCEDPGPDGLSAGVTVMSGTGENRSTTGILIEYLNEPEAGGLNTYFTLARNLTPQGSNDIIRYRFVKTSAISGNAVTKGGFVESQVAGEFFWFITLLEAHALIARYPEHSQKIVAAFRKQFSNNGGGGSNNFQPSAANGFSGNEMMSGGDFAVFSN